MGCYLGVFENLLACWPVGLLAFGLWAKRKPSKEAMWNCAFMVERM